MAIKVSDFYVNSNPPSTDYPNGSVKDDTVPGNNTGTLVDSHLQNDMLGFTDALLAEAGVTPSGVADTVISSDRLDALKKVITDNNSRGVFNTLNDLIIGRSISGSLAETKSNDLVLVIGNKTPGDGGLSHYLIQSSGGEITLNNGLTAKKQKPLTDYVFDIFITYGQSNSVGYAGQPGNPAVDDAATPVPGGWSRAYDPVSDSIVTISNTMNHLNYFLEGGGSRGNAWTAFANRWTSETGRGCVILNAGRGGASIAQLQKGNVDPYSTDTPQQADYFQRMVDGYGSTVSAMNTQGLPVGNTYMLFHQGEADQRYGTSYVEYRNSVQSLLSDVFADIPSLSKFGMYIVGCPDSRPQQSWQRIQQAQYAATRYGTANRVTNNVSVVFEGCPTFTENNGQYNPADGTHYSQRGYNQMGDVSAKNFSNWVKSDTDYNCTVNDQNRSLTVGGVGYLALQKVSAIGSFNGSDWTMLRKENTSPSDAYYPCYVESIYPTSDTVRFKMNGKAPVTYDMDVSMNENAGKHNIQPYIRKYTDGDEYGYEVNFRADLHFLVDTSTTSILSGNPPLPAGNNTLIGSTISAINAGGVTTVLHPSTNVLPTICYYSTARNEVGEVGLRSVSTQSSEVSVSGAGGSCVMKVTNVPLTISQVQTIGSFALRISAHVSDDI